MDKKVEQFKERTKNELTLLGEELRNQLSFIRKAIEEDRISLEEYREEFGDLKYRPPNSDGDGYGEPTELTMKPLVNEYRATINTLLNSLAIIENKLDNAKSFTPEKKEEEYFDAKNWLAENKKVKE